MLQYSKYLFFGKYIICTCNNLFLTKYAKIQSQNKNWHKQHATFFYVVVLYEVFLRHFEQFFGKESLAFYA